MAKFSEALRIITGASVLLLASLAAAQEYPSAQVRIIVPLPTGGSSDLVARLFANYLSERWKQTVIVENRVGAGGMIGMTAVARAKPDGYTLLFAVPSIATVRALIKDPAIDPVKDFDGVSQVIETQFAVAIPAKIPARNAAEFAAYARANPGALNAGTYAAGNRLLAEYYAQLSKMKLTNVSYRGEPLAVAALMAGEVHMVIGTAVTMKEKVDQGAIRVIAVSGNKRFPAFPDVPTAEEVGIKGFDPVLWFGLLAPAGTPAPIKAKIAAEVAQFIGRPDAIEKLHSFGFEGKASTPEEFHAFLAKDVQVWSDVAKAAGIEPQAP